MVATSVVERGPSRGAGALENERSQGANPPLLTGGLKQHRGRLVRVPWSRSIDYLSLTMPTAEAEKLCRMWEPGEPGHASEGFARSERRLVVGGEAWRRWDPYSPSKEWGLAYESWKYAGRIAQSNVDRGGLVGVGRASRVDVAFDFEVPDDETACRFWRRIEPYVRSKNIMPGVSGQGDILTRYVGSRRSTQRVRIYRKDLEECALYGALGLPPVLRIELELHEERAADFWTQLALAPEQAYGMAAGKIHALTGVTVQDGQTEWTTFERPEAFDVTQLVLAFVNQYGELVSDLDAAGVDVLALCREANVGRSRITQWRRAARRALIEAVGASVLAKAVRIALAAQSPSGGGRGGQGGRGPSSPLVAGST